LRSFVAWSLLVLGCARGVPAPAVDASASIVDQALARPSPQRVQARVGLKVSSPMLGLAGSTGGAILLDRPGRGHLAVLGPLGGPLATLQTDGVGVAIATTQDRQHRVAAQADQVLRETTGGLLGLDALLGLLVGQVPLDPARAQAPRELEDGDLEVTVLGPGESRAAVTLVRSTATPRAVVVSGSGGRVLASAVYGPFEPHPETGNLLPTEVELALPDLELTLTVRYRSWSFPEALPEVFGLAPPAGYASGPLELTGGAAAALGLDVAPP
jgi:hypothetical protein